MKALPEINPFALPVKKRRFELKGMNKTLAQLQALFRNHSFF